MSDEDPRRYRSTEELAYARMFSGGVPSGLPPDQIGPAGQRIRAQLTVDERERRDREIDACMRDVIADAIHRRNPVTGGPSLPTATPAGAGRVVGATPSNNGWRDPGPLQPAGGAMSQALIDGLVGAFQPHGAGRKAKE
jgi:hypothetical protein